MPDSFATLTSQRTFSRRDIFALPAHAVSSEPSIRHPSASLSDAAQPNPSRILVRCASLAMALSLSNAPDVHAVSMPELKAWNAPAPQPTHGQTEDRTAIAFGYQRIAGMLAETNETAQSAILEIAEEMMSLDDEFDDQEAFQPVRFSAAEQAVWFIYSYSANGFSFDAFAEDEGEVTVKVASSKGEIRIMFRGDGTIATFGTFGDNSYVKLTASLESNELPRDLVFALEQL